MNPHRFSSYAGWIPVPQQPESVINKNKVQLKWFKIQLRIAGFMKNKILIKKYLISLEEYQQVPIVWISNAINQALDLSLNADFFNEKLKLDFFITKRGIRWIPAKKGSPFSGHVISDREQGSVFFVAQATPTFWGDSFDLGSSSSQVTAIKQWSVRLPDQAFYWITNRLTVVKKWFVSYETFIYWWL